jgi:hypothetical protein
LVIGLLENLQRDADRIAKADRGHIGRERDLGQRLVGGLHQGAAGLEAAEDIHGLRQRRIDADQAIGRIDVGQLADLAIAAAQEGNHRRAASFEAEGRNRHRVLALFQQRRRQHRCRRNGALAAAAMKAYFVHPVSSSAMGLVGPVSCLLP